MTERRKILEGLRCCTDRDRQADCARCYQGGPGFGFACRENLMRDALWLLEKDEWISCKDHLPTEEGRYQVYFGKSWMKEIGLDGRELIDTALFSTRHNGWWSIEQEDFIHGVTHWKKLPEGPEEGP